MRWSKLALDLEGNSFHRYFDRVCLMQISTPEADFLFDPLEVEMFDEMRDLLQDPDRTWVLHGADYDVLSLQRDFGLRLGRVFDTMIAARFLGASALGLKGLLEAELGISIPKGEQRSDWGRRPLSPAQIGYAVQDTKHLLPLSAQLETKLLERGRLHWLEEECEILRHRVPQKKPIDPDAWLAIKGVKALPEIGQRAARGAFQWRDATAQKMDRAPFRVLGNEVITRIGEVLAERGPAALGELGKMRGIPKNLRLGSLRSAIEAELQHKGPLRRRKKGAGGPSRRPLDVQGRKCLERLRQVRDGAAKELGLDPGFLAPTALLEAACRSPVQSADALLEIEGMTRWRAEAFGSPLLEALLEYFERPR